MEGSVLLSRLITDQHRLSGPQKDLRPTRLQSCTKTVKKYIRLMKVSLHFNQAVLWFCSSEQLEPNVQIACWCNLRPICYRWTSSCSHLLLKFNTGWKWCKTLKWSSICCLGRSQYKSDVSDLFLSWCTLFIGMRTKCLSLLDNFFLLRLLKTYVGIRWLCVVFSCRWDRETLTLESTMEANGNIKNFCNACKTFHLFFKCEP